MNTITYDEIGPAKIVQLYSPDARFKAVVVVDNTALGPAIGGVRIAPGVGVQEVARLARTMTLKSSIAGIPHGGGKAGISIDPKVENFEEVFRTFARMIRDLREYIPAPDMGCHEESMVWVHDEIGRVCGLPEEIGGLPLDKLGATGFGVAECAETACRHLEIPLEGLRVAIQGFGSVGMAAARFLTAKGAIIVAASDTGGTAYASDGIDVNKLIAAKQETGSVTTFSKARVLPCEELFGLNCDILVPSATPDVIHEKNVDKIKAKIILEGANIPTTRGAEQVLMQKGTLVVPDFIANAGGLIMAATEYAGGSEDEAFAAISKKIKLNTQRILEKARSENSLPRMAAEALARERVLKAMRYRRYTYPPRLP